MSLATMKASKSCAAFFPMMMLADKHSPKIV